MVASFAKEGRLNAEIQLGLITFGVTVEQHLALSPAYKIDGIQRLDANGPTPMGAAFDKATQLLEDKEHQPGLLADLFRKLSKVQELENRERAGVWKRTRLFSRWYG